MARIKKKGTSGAAKNYISRTQAVNKLQVSLADFRRLCIFKGIYPREPRNKKKANKGRGLSRPATFYYARDIQYLLHEPVLAKFREHKTFSKKLQRALSRKDFSDADRLEKNRPRYKLDHLVRERYPVFAEALRDLDDPLNMLFLFAGLPSTKLVSHKVLRQATKLCNEWMAYVARERLITKVFVSVKGVYYQALVRGQDVRWLVPFKFPTAIPSDVDLRIMSTFLEFYSTLLHFVLYKLYLDLDLVYPPPVDLVKIKGVGGLLAYVMKLRSDALAQIPNAAETETPETDAQPVAALSADQLEAAKEADAEAAQPEPEASVETVALDEFSQAATKTPGDVLAQPLDYALPTLTLFDRFTFYVGREVPLDFLEVCILSCGGRVVLEIALDEMKLTDPEAYKTLDLSSITHQLVDRPKVANKVVGRTYVQPQWVFDSINKGELVLASLYAPGELLPPHLSPWGDSGAYDPEAPPAAASDEEEEEVSEEEADSADEELAEQRELEAEAAGVAYSEQNADKSQKSKAAKAKKAKADAEEEQQLKQIMLTKKQKKVYERSTRSKGAREQRVAKLTQKRKQLDKAKKDLDKK